MVLVVVGLVVLIIIAIIFLVKKNKGKCFIHKPFFSKMLKYSNFSSVVPKLGPSSEYRSVAEYRSTLADRYIDMQ